MEGSPFLRFINSLAPYAIPFIALLSDNSTINRSFSRAELPHYFTTRRIFVYSCRFLVKNSGCCAVDRLIAHDMCFCQLAPLTSHLATLIMSRARDVGHVMVVEGKSTISLEPQVFPPILTLTLTRPSDSLSHHHPVCTRPAPLPSKSIQTLLPSAHNFYGLRRFMWCYDAGRPSQNLDYGIQSAQDSPWYVT